MSQLERGRQEPAEEGRLPAPWERPWLPWAIGAGLFLLGVLIGWASAYLAVRPLLHALPAVVEQPRTGEDRAAVEGEAVLLVAGEPSQQVTLEWQVINTGDSTWVVDSYRFVPVGGGARVLALPGAVHPGASVAVTAHLTAPALSPSRAYMWELTGPGGPVPGGRFGAIVSSGSPGRRPQGDPTR